MHAAGGVGAFQREHRNADLEVFTRRGPHVITAGHESGWRLERGPAGIFKSAPRRDDGLFPDDAVAAAFANASAAVRNAPIARQELHACFAFILDGHPIGPEIAAFFRIGLILQKIGLDSDFDIARRFFVTMPAHAYGSTVTSVF